MGSAPWASLQLFVAERNKDLQRIVRHSKGEQQLDDVISESWLLARELCSDETLVELRNTDIQDQLLRRLYNFFVYRGERTLRYAVRLDSGNDDMDEPSDIHPLMHILADPGPDPLTVLLNREEIPTRTPENSVDIDCSLAGAYARLEEHFDSSWRRVAEHLGLSSASVRKRNQDAVFIARHQHSLPSPMPAGFLPGPWFKARFGRIPRQLMFEFSYQLAFQKIEPAPSAVQ